MSNAIKSIARKAFIAAVLIGTVAMTGCSATASSSSNAPLGSELATREEIHDVDAIRPGHVINRSKDHVTRSGEVYLMRGLANVFSRGIDKIADKMRARGFDAANFSYKYWKPIAQNIVTRAKNDTVSYPVIIIGHSLGGNESSKFANYLAANGVKVDLVIAFDPVETGHVGHNIGAVVNYYLPMEKTDNRIHAVSGFDGELKNIDVTYDKSITHTNVEKNAGLQKASIDRAMAITSLL